MDGSSLKGRVARLLAGGFFAEAKTQGATRTELKRTGTDVNTGNLSKAFADFLSDGLLERGPSDTYQAAAGIKVTERTVER